MSEKLPTTSNNYPLTGITQEAAPSMTPYVIKNNEQVVGGALTNDGGKPPLAKLPWKALREVSLVQLYGQQKYGDFDNYKKGMEVSRNLSCAVRHIADYMDGHDLDSESGRSHLAHAAARLLFVLENISDRKVIDDRLTQTNTN